MKVGAPVFNFACRGYLHTAVKAQNNVDCSIASHCIFKHLKCFWMCFVCEKTILLTNFNDYMQVQGCTVVHFVEMFDVLLPSWMMDVSCCYRRLLYICKKCLQTDWSSLLYHCSIGWSLQSQLPNKWNVSILMNQRLYDQVYLYWELSYNNCKVKTKSQDSSLG